MGLVFWILRLMGILRVEGWKNFPKQKGKILLVSNHPSLVEPVLLSGLFFHQYAIRPKLGPFTLADKRNYYNKWWAYVLRPRLIPVDRAKLTGDAGSLVTATKVIESGANVVVFPEGGRTFKGLSFLISPNGRKKIRPLKSGFALLATMPGVTLVPVWFESDNWISMKMVIGTPMNFKGVPREEVIKKTGNIILELADQAS
jgi:1-acyl-sn-glycerol-3-phosphate acyltransferase